MVFSQKSRAYDYRDPSILTLPKYNTITHGKKCFMYEGAKLWNSISNGIKTIENSEFKTLLKKWNVLPLVDHVNQSVTNFTYLLIMARLLAAMINDYEEYILCYVKTFVYSLLIYHFILRSLFSFTYDCEYTI